VPDDGHACTCTEQLARRPLTRRSGSSLADR